MGFKRVAEPTLEPVTVDEAKAHCRIDTTEEDDLVAIYIAAARAHVENLCHISVAETEWELTLDAFPALDDPINIPKSPIIAVTSVKYDDSDGNEQTLTTDDYAVDLSGSFGKIVRIATSWPTVEDDAIGVVRVRFTAGWEDDGNSPPTSLVPAPLKAAILLLVCHYYERRGVVADGGVTTIPFAVESLIGPYRMPVVA